MSWITHNRWYLVALAIVAPAAVLVALGAGWFSYVEAEDGRPIAVEPGDAIEYAGASWVLTDSGSIAAEDDGAENLGLLPGTSLVFVEVEVTPGSAAPDCTLQLIDAPGVRMWSPASYSDVDLEADEDAETYCSPDAEGKYTLQSWFVVPDDAVADSKLRLWSREALPDHLVVSL